MKKILISLFLLIGLVGVIIAQPHTAIVGFTNNAGATVDAADVTWTAERLVDHPGDILDPTTSLSTAFYPSIMGPQGAMSMLQVQCADFANPWAAGQVVSIHIEQVSTGDYLDVDITLTSAGSDVWDATYTPIQMMSDGPVAPAATTLLMPADAAVDVAVDADIQWNAEPNADAYKIYFGTDNPPMTMVMEQADLFYNPTVNYGTTYYWQIVPTNNAGDAPNCPVWSFTTVDYDDNPADGVTFGDVPEDVPTPTVTETGDGTGSGMQPEDTFNAQYQITISYDGVLTLTLAHTIADLGLAMLENLGNAPIANIVWGVGTVTFDCTFSVAKSAEDFVIWQDNPEPLAVEFATFAAAQMAVDGDVAVELTWETASESDLATFNVYRTDVEAFEDAALLTSVVPNNQASTYKVVDNEVEDNYTYYYWVECIDIDGQIDLHKSEPITIDAESVVPVTRTIMGNAYPNPFGTETTLNVSVKDGEVANITVYNVLGQAVRNFTANESREIKWDGTDANGRNCGSGIYFFRLSSPSNTATKKVVVVK